MSKGEMKLPDDNIARDHDGKAKPKKHSPEPKASIKQRTGAADTNANPK